MPSVRQYGGTVPQLRLRHSCQLPRQTGQLFMVFLNRNLIETEPKLILNSSECVKADRDEPEGDEGRVDAAVCHHTRLLQVKKVP